LLSVARNDEQYARPVRVLKRVVLASGQPIQPSTRSLATPAGLGFDGWHCSALSTTLAQNIAHKRGFQVDIAGEAPLSLAPPQDDGARQPC